MAIDVPQQDTLQFSWSLPSSRTEYPTKVGCVETDKTNEYHDMIFQIIRPRFSKAA